LIYHSHINSHIVQTQYFRIRLLNADSRWRNDKYYLFYAYDCITKNRIAESKNIDDFVSNNYENFYKYGAYVPKSITGSKNYWKGKYYDLEAIVKEIGNI
jgi:hypothetical protein